MHNPNECQLLTVDMSWANLSAAFCLRKIPNEILLQLNGFFRKHMSSL